MMEGLVKVAKSIQTDFRESEAQTDPYSPDIIIVLEGEGIEYQHSIISSQNDDTENKNNQSFSSKKEKKKDEELYPELISLKHLTCANGKLPASHWDLIRILRAQKRREEFAKLPPAINNDATAQLHKLFLEEQERKDFMVREAELNEQIGRRIQAYSKDLKERDQNSQIAAQRRLDIVSKKANKKCQSGIHQLNKKYSQQKLNTICSSSSSLSMSKNDAFFSQVNHGENNIWGNHHDPVLFDTSKIKIIEKTVRQHNLDVHPKRPPKKLLGNSIADRKTLSLAADLHLWATLIQSKGNEEAGTESSTGK